MTEDHKVIMVDHLAADLWVIVVVAVCVDRATHGMIAIWEAAETGAILALIVVVAFLTRGILVE